jgi:membrane fusion protein (multidrug efflux system)
MAISTSPMSVSTSARAARNTTADAEVPQASRRRRWIAAGAFLLLVVAALGGIKVLQIGSMIKAGKSFAMPPEAVTTATATAGEWESVQHAPATLVALHGVTLSSEVGGTVRQIAYESGSVAKQGELLVRLDTSTEEAQLEGAVADAAVAKSDAQRTRLLHQRGATTQSELETAEAKALQTQSTVDSLRATIAKKTLRAPFDGRLGIRPIEIGQVVSPGTAIASLQSVSPIYAEFWLPQQALSAVKVGQRVRVTSDVFPASSWEGSVTTVNPEVDITTRNVRIRATVDNADGRLTPGMFVDLAVLANEKHPVVSIPETSVVFAPYGDSVFVVEPEKDASGKEVLTAHQHFVRLGEHQGDFVAVTSGLSGGETVVSTGAFKLKNGAKVMVNNALAPTAELAPQPVDK